MVDAISERGKKKLIYNHYIFWRDGQSSMFGCQMAMQEPTTKLKVNKVEGHHNLINKMLSMQHPTIWKFIEALRKLQNINKNKIEALCAQGPPAKRRKYKDLDAQLKTKPSLKILQT